MKKKSIVISTIFSVFLLGSILFVSLSQNPTSSNELKLSPSPLLQAAGVSKVKNFVLAKEIDDKKQDVKVYKVKKVDAKEKAIKLASLFGVKNTKDNISDDNYTISGDGGSVTVSANGGGFVYYKDIDPSSEGEMPSLDDSIKIAKEYLEKVDLYYPEMKVSGMDEETVEYSDGRKEIKNRNVYFQHTLNNIRISSGTTRVQIGKNSTIEIVAENNKELEEIGVYSIKTTSEAIEDAKNGKGVYAGDKEIADTGYIQNVELVYMDNGPLSAIYQQYQPIYILNGALDSPDSKDKFTVQVRALNDSSFSENQTSEKKSEPINQKEFLVKNPDQVILSTPDLSIKSKEIESSSNLSNLMGKILQSNNGTVEGYGDYNEVVLKMNDLVGSSSNKLEINYSEPSKTSVQFGKNLIKGQEHKDKYGNLTIDIIKIVIPVDKKEKNDKLFVLGPDKGYIVKLDSSSDIQSLIDSIPTP